MSVAAPSATVPSEDAGSSKRVLDPADRISEILFGLIMVLTFTGSLSVAAAGRAEVREMLVGALGCNLAWGIIDALFYLMGILAEKGRALSALRAVHGAADPQEGQRIVAGALPPLIASILEPAQVELIRQRLKGLGEPPDRPRLHADDGRGALGVFLLVMASTFPVAIPFFLIHDAHRALRFSNAVAVTMLFVCGYAWGRLSRYHPWLTGLGMVVVGSALVAMTMALGG